MEDIEFPIFRKFTEIRKNLNLPLCLGFEKHRLNVRFLYILVHVLCKSSVKKLLPVGITEDTTVIVMREVPNASSSYMILLYQNCEAIQ